MNTVIINRSITRHRRAGLRGARIGVRRGRCCPAAGGRRYGARPHGGADGDIHRAGACAHGGGFVGGARCGGVGGPRGQHLCGG